MANIMGVFIIGYQVILDAVHVVYLIDEHGLSEGFAGTNLGS